MDEVANSSQFASAVTEAANRAEVTALLIRCGYRVYRPEADTHGEDLVVRTPEGRLLGVQMKGRATVNGKKYGGKDLLMLFPSARYNLGIERQWFLVPHDQLFDWIKAKHGHSPKWQDEWSYPAITNSLGIFLQPYLLRPAADVPERFVEDGVGLLVFSPDGKPINLAARTESEK
jgi:hypothetical protein